MATSRPQCLVPGCTTPGAAICPLHWFALPWAMRNQVGDSGVPPHAVSRSWLVQALEQLDPAPGLEALPVWAQRCVALLMAGLRPQQVAERLGCAQSLVSRARARAVAELGTGAEAIPRWRRGRSSIRIDHQVAESQLVSVWTTSAPDGHRHIAIFDEGGRGATTRTNGHHHPVLELDVVATDHRHDLTDQRASNRR